jgi:hypothetical protein
MSAGEVGLEQGTGDPGHDQHESEGGNHRELGERSEGRESTKVTIAVSTTVRTTRAATAVV